MQHFYRISRFALATIFLTIFTHTQAQVIMTVAGGGNGDGGPATTSPLNYPFSVTTDAAGNIYIVDQGHNSIRKINTSGIISTIAGNGTQGFYGDGGPATAAELNSPVSMVFDGSGNMYISDYGNNRIRMINTTGIITTYAGNGNYGYAGDGGQATAAELNTPQQIAIDHSGKLYIVDYSNNVVRVVNRNTGIISTIAGNGIQGFYGDGAAATLAELNYPTGVATDLSGNIYIADRGNYSVRMVNTSGIISTFAGNQIQGYNGTNGKADTTELNAPNQITVDSSGNVYIADQYANLIRKVNTSGIMSTIAGNGTGSYSGDGAAATLATLNSPEGVAFDAAGNIYIADYYNSTIREVNTSGIISTIAGSYNFISFYGNGVPATAAILNTPQGVALDKSGNIIFADYNNARIREVNASTHIITTIAGNGTQGFLGDGGLATAAELHQPEAIAIDDSDNIYFADEQNFRIRKITKATGKISTIAGNGINGYTGENGKADTSEIAVLTGIAVDTNGNIYYSDQSDNLIRKITKATGRLNTVVGIPLGGGGYNGDGIATATQIYAPMGLAVDKFGNVYFGDNGNYITRELKVSSDSVITIAGQYDNYGAPTIGTNVLATSIGAFNSISALAVDTAGNVYITDVANNNMVKVTKFDTMTVVSGIGGEGEYTYYNGDNIMANTAYLNAPNGIAVDDSGNVYFADANNNRVREIRITGQNITSQPPVNAEGCLGAPLKIGIGEQGPGAVYQWQVDTTGIWKNLSNAGNFSGVNTDSLSLAVVSSSPDLAFRCVLNSGYVTSDSSVLLVNYPLSVYMSYNGYDSICAAMAKNSGVQLSESSGAKNILWSNGATVSQPWVYIGSTQTFYVTLTDDYGCITKDSVTVLINKHTLKSHALPSTTVCKGTQVTLYATGNDGAKGLYWPSGPGPTETVTADSSFALYVSGYDIGGCDDSSLIKITVVSSPTVTATASKDSICQGASVTLTASGASTYNWNDGISSGVPFSPLSSSVYVVTGTDVHGCTNTTSIPVIVTPLPVITGSISSGAVCAGSSVTLSGNGAASYSWSGGVTNAVPFVPATSGTYTVTGTSAAGCVNTAAVSVTVDPLPAITASAFPAATLCQGTSLALFGGGGASYSWSGGANNGVSFTPSSSVTYTVTGIDANGCKNKDSIQVKVFNKVVPIITSANTSCGMKNGMASVSASNGIPPYTYSWSTSPAKYSSSIDSLAAGTYVVSVSDSANCASTVAVSIGGSTAPILSVSSTNSNCGSVGTGSASVLVTGGTAPYHYMWNNGDTLTNDYNLKAATYIITVTDVNGCSTFAPAIVSNNNGPKITTSSIVNVKCYGAASGAINVSVTGGVAPYQYTWSNGSSSASIGSLFAGPYQLTVMDADSCTSVESFIITQPAAATSIVSSSVKADCGLNDGSASVVVTGGLAPYHYLWNTGVTSAADVSIGAGVYVVTVTDANGCIDSAHVSVSDKTGPALVLSLASNAACGSGGLLSVAASGATAPYTYLWSDGNTNTSISNVPAGNYNVTVTDAHGCVSSADTTVSEATPPAIAICMVTVDPITSKYNYVIWDKSSAKKIVSYNIYKETTVAGVYQKIASVPFASLGVYTDSLSAPTVRSWRYEISQVDSCGNESPMSLPHKTMHLTVNQGVGNNINLIWDNYQGLAFSTYYVYRDTIGTNFTVIDSIPNNIFTYTDNNPPVTKKPLLYRIGISNPGGCTPSIEAVNYNASKSNTGNFTITGAQNISAATFNSLQVFPNPSTGFFTFSLQLENTQNLSLAVINTLGQTIYTQSYSRVAGMFSRQIDLSGFAKGVYVLKLTTNNSVVYRKVVIQ